MVGQRGALFFPLVAMPETSWQESVMTVVTGFMKLFKGHLRLLISSMRIGSKLKLGLEKYSLLGLKLSEELDTPQEENSKNHTKYT